MELRKLDVIQVVSGLPPSDGGPSFTVPRLNEALEDAGVNGWIFSDRTPDDPAFDGRKKIRTFPCQFVRVPILGRLRVCSGLSFSLLKREERVDLIHSHGLWRMPNLYAARAASDRGVPIVVSPRGMLSEFAWQFSRRSKTIFWLLAQRKALRATQCFHATSVSEFEEIRRSGFLQPVAIIPNGVDLPAATESVRFQASDEHRSKTLLYLGRVHPIKGIDTLVTAWSKVAPEFPDWRLRIVGPSEPEHLHRLSGAVKRLDVPRVSLEGALYGRDKWEALAKATLFVLPTHNENFGMTVAESLASGRPVIVTKGAPWKRIEAHGCGWWIDFGEEAMVSALRTALRTPLEVLDGMGQRGREWMKKDFTWEAVGQEMAKVYRWLCGAGDRPAIVRLN